MLFSRLNKACFDINFLFFYYCIYGLYRTKFRHILRRKYATVVQVNYALHGILFLWSDINGSKKEFQKVRYA